MTVTLPDFAMGLRIRALRTSTALLIALGVFVVAGCTHGGNAGLGTNDTVNSVGTSATTLTITGSIAQKNRDRFRPFRDALFNAHSADFEAAYEFTERDMANFEQHTLTAKYPNWDTSVTATGPRVADLLAHVGANGEVIVVQALDGYLVEFAFSALMNSHAIIALRTEDGPIGIGGRGPNWIFFPPGAVEGQAIEDDRALVWGIYRMAVE